MAKEKSTDQLFNDMVQQEMQGNGRSLATQQAINRGRALRAPAPAPDYDHPQIADDMRDFRNDTMFNFARDNGMVGNGQGFSSRDYLNAVDLFDKYMKGETNDTSWSDFFDKHGLKPISRSNLEKRYRASWDSDAGKGQGPVPTGEQQAIMQQVAQAQQGGGSTVGPVGDGSANNTTVKQNPEAANNLAYDSLYAPDGSVGISQEPQQGLSQQAMKDPKTGGDMPQWPEWRDDSYGRSIQNTSNPFDKYKQGWANEGSPAPKRKGDAPQWPSYKDIFPDW